MDRMDNFVAEIALKAENILNIAIFQCMGTTNLTTATLNAEFALGQYFALMDIVKAYNMEWYIGVTKSTEEVRNKLSNIVNNIYSVGGNNNE